MVHGDKVPSPLNSGLRLTAAKDWGGRILERDEVFRVGPELQTRHMQRVIHCQKVDKEREIAHLVDLHSGQA